MMMIIIIINNNNNTNTTNNNSYDLTDILVETYSLKRPRPQRTDGLLPVGRPGRAGSGRRLLIVIAISNNSYQ